MKHIFNSVPFKRPKKNKFDLTHDVKMTMDMGNLTPCMVMECVPGDSVRIQAESLIRMAPMIAPVYHRLDASIHYFFVPNRILWDGWEKWISDPASTLVHPYIELTSSISANFHKFWEYFGIPRRDVVPTADDLNPERINPFALAAYQCIYNEYYRDQNLIPEVGYKLVNGAQSGGLINVLATHRKRAWEHDYYTASLPWAQKGGEVSIPLGDVTFKSTEDGFIHPQSTVHNPLTGDPITTTGAISNAATTGGLYSGNTSVPVAVNNAASLQVESTTINDLRRAFRLQEWLEKNARSGTRYVENILAHFGVRSSDKRLQRPEYICGLKTPITISEVLNTTGQTGGLPQGNYAGHGIAATSGRSGNFFCEEHGYIIGIMSVMPKTAYNQGMPKHFLKVNDQFQYYWPAFANIGEQEVYGKEIYSYDSTSKDLVFGYVPRYAEYKFLPSRVAGNFSDSLDFWHLGRSFATPPALNQAFVECVPDKRIFAVEDPAENSLFVHVLNKVSAIRPMPKYGTPHF